MPEERDLSKITRQFVIDIVNTVVKEPFRIWVKLRVEERNEKIKSQMDLNLKLDPEIAKAFHASTNVSSKYFQSKKKLDTNIFNLFSFFSDQWQSFALTKGKLKAQKNSEGDD